MKDMSRVLEALEDGPGTSGEIAAELGMSMNVVSAYLSVLKKMGSVKVIGQLRGRGRVSNICAKVGIADTPTKSETDK